MEPETKAALDALTATVNDIAKRIRGIEADIATLQDDGKVAPQLDDETKSLLAWFKRVGETFYFNLKPE